tara:strand:- start:225 stop:434 length:210 start_codon:yes stop_codon:yes gene_type:complete
MTKTEARQRIRNLKSSILNSTEIFAEALANSHYKTANVQSVIIMGNLRELNKLRTKIKLKKDAISQNNA